MEKTNEELEKEFIACFQTRAGKVRFNKKMDRNVLLISVLMTGVSIVGVVKGISPAIDLFFKMGIVGGAITSLQQLRQGFPLEKDDEKDNVI